MLNKILISCFILLRDRRGESFAESEYKLIFGFVMSPYYMALLGAIGIWGYKRNYAPLVDNVSLLNGILLFLPFFAFVYFYTNSQDTKEFIFPTNPKKVIVTTMFIGFFLMFFVPVLFNAVL